MFDAGHLRRLLGAGCGAVELRGVRFQMWREMSGWAVLGVILSEATANAHAYLVTFISGPHAFAVLPVGTLLMRPVSLVSGGVAGHGTAIDVEALRPARTARALSGSLRNFELQRVQSGSPPTCSPPRS